MQYIYRLKKLSLVLGHLSSRSYTRTRWLFERIGKDDNTHIRFSTIEKVRSQGVTGIIWEEV